MLSIEKEKCPCGSDEPYQDCCQLIHNNIAKALTAEQLMRSRFTAFTLAMGDFLLESHHKTTRPTNEMDAIISWAKSVDWKNLQIISAINGKKNDSIGTVAFKAHFLTANKPDLISENSEFVKEDGVWYYLRRIEW